ncbi:MAG: DUF4836 family protein [Parafilimonas sp.]
MKNKLLAFAATCFLIIAFAACKNAVPKLALYIPKDASVVFAVDPKSVMDKIASSGITIDSLANLFTKKSDDYSLRWNDIKNSGIDLSKSIYFFTKQTNAMQTGAVSSSGIIAEVQDAAKLEAFLKKEKVGKDVLSGGKYKYITLGNDFIAGWTDKILIVSAVTGGTSAPGTYSTGEGTLSQLQLTTLFSQEESASIAAADGFNDMLSKKGDMHFYTNAYANLSANPMLGMSKLSSLLEGSYTSGAISFDNGKIVADATTHNSKALSDILSKYPSKEIDKDMITKFPGDVSGLGIISFNPKVLIDILHYAGFDVMANGYVAQMGFTIDDIMNAFSGDIAFVASDLSIKQNNSQNMDNMNAPEKNKYLLIMRIGDKAAFDKVMSGLVNKHVLSKNGDQYQLGFSGGHDFAIETSGNDFVAGSSDELIKLYESGNGKSNLPGDVTKEINNKSMAMYIDINAILKNVNTNDSAGEKVRTFAQSTFKNFIASSDKGDGKNTEGNFTLNFANANENSLASLARFISIAHDEEITKKENPSSIFMDSIPDMNKDEKDSQ